MHKPLTPSFFVFLVNNAKYICFGVTFGTVSISLNEYTTDLVIVLGEDHVVNIRKLTSTKKERSIRPLFER